MYKFITFIFLLLGGNTVFSQHKISFKPNETVVFIGNSITQDGRYHMLFHSYCATKFPSTKLSFYNTGIAGDVTGGMLKRYKEDILTRQPDYAFLMSGMNDVMSHLYAPSLKVTKEVKEKRKKAIDTYKNNFLKMVALLQESKITPILIAPSIYDQTSEIAQENKIGVNDALEECAAFVLEYAKSNNILVVDFFHLLSDINTTYQQENPSFTIIGKDRVHPEDAGHYVMAGALVKEVLEKHPYAYSMISKSENMVIFENECTVVLSNKNKPNQFSFDRKSSTLPFPSIPQFKKGEQFSNVFQTFNTDIIAVSGLEKGEYLVEIDNKTIGHFSHQQLQNGINLAVLSETPQYKQAQKVIQLCSEYHQLQAKVRSVALTEYRMLNDYKGPATFEAKLDFLLEKLEKQRGKSWYAYNKKTIESYKKYVTKVDQIEQKMTEVRSNIYKENKPQKHHYKITKKSLLN
ncbi:SGNH/GDSL hydrolase family protein [Flammeovirga aprica]|uniref:SGNH/GDSL hydrolase family protein n=1 Tax=Flammeovirga aprica JL-4 TaxID=694437 RepID=A0A7X9P039_9BACT|nr:SGNH/GDSL hydrolase family protein [Flammeovirga aprica]NME66748.1 SGNH/GDSL hydrolase family protein [Flammeovirga aprica JL-4]